MNLSKYTLKELSIIREKCNKIEKKVKTENERLLYINTIFQIKLEIKRRRR